jgi:hypothetical protein
VELQQQHVLLLLLTSRALLRKSRNMCFKNVRTVIKTTLYRVKSGKLLVFLEPAVRAGEN